ncbi:MAG: GGDEF domain-containing protein [Terracidiphilus sp.]|jgi:diguanylate cyclase (GGDEF)-like protein
MKRLITTFAIALGWASAACAAAPATLTTLRDIHALGNAGASKRLPVAFEATVTYYRGYENMLFVQNGDVGIYVRAPMDARLVPGDRVLVRGRTQDSFRPFVMSDSVTLLRHGGVPKPVPASFDDLIRMQSDCLLVTVRAVVRSADPAWGANGPTYLQMITNKGYVDAVLDSDDASARKELLDAEVEVTGVATGKLDGKLQETGIKLYVPTIADVKILKRASANPLSLPMTPMAEVLTRRNVHDFTPRVRVHGSITYYQPGSVVVLQDGAWSLRIMTQSNIPLRIGDLADATGFPDVQDGFLALTHGEIRDSGIQAPVQPLPSAWQQLSSSNHIFDLVSLQGRVVAAVRGSAQDEFVLASDGHLFSAIYHHPDAASHIHLPPMKEIAPGSRIRVNGICMLKDSNPFNGPLPFDILLRSFDDIEVVARPSWLNVRNLVLIVGLLLLVVVAVGARGWFIERKVRCQTTALAYIEQRRSRILEDINGSRPLAEIIEQITELVSFKLHGSPCWCQIADGALLGNCPQKLFALRIVQHEISGRSGPARGTIFAAFDPLTRPAPIESEALSMAAGLATLAIETRRLYSDLLRRSEFDLLTDIHNRFSLDKRLDAQIEEARRKAGIFGLIYIDLDHFKQINDLYGHQVGDLYLQQVALRMKSQLRSVDTLARLGGDEFAALVPVVRSRADVEEIAQRLERSFEEPFAAEGYVLQGSASIGIALYPQDAVTQDSLLSFADAAMYKAKNTKRQIDQMLADPRNPEPTRTLRINEARLAPGPVS